MKADPSLITKALRRHINETVIVVLFLVFLQTVSAVQAETVLKKASFAPQWLPQAQFAGYMVALEKGSIGKLDWI